MEDQENKSCGFWSRFWNFTANHKTELHVIAFLSVFHVFLNYVAKRKSPRYDFSSVPEACPGPETDRAGLTPTCDGCPNKTYCSTNNPNSVDPLLNNGLKEVDNIIIVASGKGGVGKSTVATQVAFCLDHLGKKVGLLDVDITGPSVPSMTGTSGEEVFESLLGWTPVYVNENLSVMSIGYLMNNAESCVTWRGAKKDALIKKFLSNVNWGQLDYLIIDTPPGTSDEHLSLVNTLKAILTTDSENTEQWSRVKSILVTTPQKRAIDDVKRSAQFCEHLGIDIMMLVENMTNSFLDPANPGPKGRGKFKFGKKEDSKMAAVNTTDLLREMCDKYNIGSHVRVDSNAVITHAGETGASLVEDSPFLYIAKLILKL